MPFVALEWDHKLAKSWIRWLVVECDRVEMRHGGTSPISSMINGPNMTRARLPRFAMGRMSVHPNRATTTAS